MHPLSVFPSLFTYSLIVPLLIRLILASVGAVVAQKNMPARKWVAVLEALAAIFIFLGLYTQPAAIFGLALLAFEWWTERKTAPLSGERMMVYSLVKILLISLLFLGPGFLAFDLPL